MDQSQSLLTLPQIEAQVFYLVLTGAVGLGLAWLRKHLNLQEQSTSAVLVAKSNQVLQNATANFAGKVAGAIAAGTLSKSDAVNQLQSYLKTTAAESFATLAPTFPILVTMLEGKLAALPVPSAAGPFPSNN